MMKKSEKSVDCDQHSLCDSKSITPASFSASTNSIKLYHSESCPCPADCVRHGKCKECIAFHHNLKQDTYCEMLNKKFNFTKSDTTIFSKTSTSLEISTGSDEGRPKSGREIRLLDYTKCAG